MKRVPRFWLIEGLSKWADDNWASLGDTQGHLQFETLFILMRDCFMYAKCI